MLTNVVRILSTTALASSAVAIHALKPISDLSDLGTGAPSRRQAPGIAAFDPQNEYSFLYAQQGKSSAYVANFTLQAPGDEEAIIPIEKFAEQLKSIQCNDTSKTISITFASRGGYDYASKVWDWVNEKKEHTFTLVTKAGQCDPDEIRDPFSVTGIAFHPSDLSATLTATRQTWANAAHNFHLTTTHVKYDKTPAYSGNARRWDNSTTNSTFGSDGDDGYVFFDDHINKLFAIAEDVESRLFAANATNATSLPHLQDEVEKAIEDLAAAIEAKSIAILKDIGEVYGGEVEKLVRETQRAYEQLNREADKKYREADKIADTDIDASWELFDDAIELQDKASQKIEDAFTKINSIVLGQQPPVNTTAGIAIQRRNSKARFGKRGFDLFKTIGDGFKKVGEAVVNGVANLLGANKPATLNLATSFSAPVFETDKSQFGIALKAGPELETGGKIVGEVEVKVQFDKPSTFRLTVKPDNIFARAEFKIEADGTLTGKLDKELAGKDIPVGGAGFEVPGLIKVGPFVHLGVHAGIERMEAKEAKFRVGAKATIPENSIVLLDAIDGKNNKLEGWVPQVEQIGPEFTGELSGGAAAWLALGVNFGADILGGKFTAKAGIEVQAPKFGLDFNVTNNPEGVCDKTTKKTQAVEFGASVGINVNIFAGLTADPPKTDLFNQKWPLFPNQCFPFGAEGAPAARGPLAGRSTLEGYQGSDGVGTSLRSALVQAV